jgi:glycosyltransferase involved in cell wall biosynthesis
MRIGIVTPAFNVAPYIGIAIRSVQAQSHQDWTMTIVDDGSTDQTAAIAADFNDPRVRPIRQRNTGVSVARNRGLAATEADAILFLDGDDWLSPDALSTLAASLRDTPNAIAAVGSYVQVHGDGQIASRVRRPPSGALLESLLVRNSFVNGGHLLIHRSMLHATGLFHSGLSYGEDWEYWIRLARLGSFAAARSRAPLLFVRERQESAYRGMATQTRSFAPCMDAIFDSPALKVRLGATVLARLRQRAEAENDWIVGRELIRHGQLSEGRHFLRKSVAKAPSLKRLALLAAVSLPMPRIGPFRPYPSPTIV